MGTQKLLFIKTRFVVVKIGSVIVSLTRKMGFFFFSLLSTLFDFVRQCFFRLKRSYIASKKNSSPVLIQSPKNHQPENKIEEKNGDFGGDDHKSESLFLFRFRTYEEYMGRNGESINDKTAQSVNCEKELSEKLNGGFVNIKKSKNDDPINGISADNSVHAVNSFTEKGTKVEYEEQSSESFDNSTIVAHFLNDDDDDGGDQCIVSDSDSESMVSSTKSSLRNPLVDSKSDGFLSDIDFQRAFAFDASNELPDASTKENIELSILSKEYEVDDLEEEDEEMIQELKNFEQSTLETGNVTSQENGVTVRKPENKEIDDNKPNSGEQLSSDSDEQNELERQWEHQDIVEQLKMEIRKVRAIGLPTILEESESPKISEDLKPWKIDDIEKFQHEGTLDELQKLYKSYKERMRILDLLNYQKMYAIGFLQRKDPLQSLTRRNISPQTIGTIVSLDCWPCKSKSATEIHQPVMKTLSRELESDLETVYVGQMCLSWDFLHLQYNKALELWDSDPHGICQYNEVAERFRQFQVLLARFLEDEPFHGPRVQHYVKSRCVVRYLLHVPVIREDHLKDKKRERRMGRSKDVVTSTKLVELIEESIRIFWKFIRADKETSITILLKCRRVSNIELQNAGDANLFAQIRSSLLKKERKLKELLRSENCILRKLQTQQEDNSSDHVLYFFSDVDLRIVQRVLNMSKITTEQLVWCRDKLNKIHFVGKKLLVEPSITLFPCS